jgi:hypothetical protein
MESAQAHQKLAETHLERLRAHTEDLDEVVRDEIRRTLVEELAELTGETQRAAQALGKMKRHASLRGLLWSGLAAGLSTLIPIAIAHWLLPTGAQIQTLTDQRDQLEARIAGLSRNGGRVDWRHCGEEARLCARIDKSAPTYGEKGDYYVLKGY